MKIPYNWLAEFVDLPDDPQVAADRLSMAGLECAGVARALAGLGDLVVAEVQAVEPHPDADKLSVCRVDAGQGEPLQIVCGAPNVRAGMKVPAVLPGGELPDGTEIKRTSLRGVESAGMLCSARELGLGDDHSGLLALPEGAAVGGSVVEALGGDEAVLEIEVTPNRGDVLSLLGVARDLAVILDTPLREPEVPAVSPDAEDRFGVKIEDGAGCPVFAGRVIRGVDAGAPSPGWLRERLRRAGIRPVNAVVDVTQYVMLELGQPMHAYDLSRLSGAITVRRAAKDERVALLDGSEPALDDEILVIADDARCLGLAGIMGGAETGVGGESTDIFLESAFFDPSVIQGRGRRFGLNTDAGYRFERGVDPTGQARAIERATALIQSICGGRPGPTEVHESDHGRPARNRIELARGKLEGLLGIQVPDDQVRRILTGLGMPPEETRAGWSVQAPPHRFDVAIPEDLVEEVGRIHGYERIPARQYPADRPMTPVPENHVPLRQLRRVLVERGYHEVITYSFVDSAVQSAMTGEQGIPLGNPITAEMTHMRASLWPGLVQALQHNLNRQRGRVRIFECGMRFLQQDNEIKQEMVLAGLAAGPQYPEQWGLDARPAGFEDVRADIEALVGLGPHRGGLNATAQVHPALHPGRSAAMSLGEEPIGMMGGIHPGLAAKFDLPGETVLFELRLEPLQAVEVPALAPISRFPAVRRDLALVLPEDVAAGEVLDVARSAAGESLRDIVIFDVYRGTGLKNGTKSLAIGLILQKISSTLTDTETESVVKGVFEALKERCGAQLRE